MTTPSVFANIDHPKVYDFVRKWLTLDPLFNAARENNLDELTNMLIDMTHFNPIDKSGKLLSKHFRNWNDYCHFIYTLCANFNDKANSHFDRHNSSPCQVGVCLITVCDCLCKGGTTDTACEQCQYALKMDRECTHN